MVRSRSRRVLSSATTSASTSAPMMTQYVRRGYHFESTAGCANDSLRDAGRQQPQHPTMEIHGCGAPCHDRSRPRPQMSAVDPNDHHFCEPRLRDGNLVHAAAATGLAPRRHGVRHHHVALDPAAAGVGPVQGYSRRQSTRADYDGKRCPTRPRRAREAAHARVTMIIITTNRKSTPSGTTLPKQLGANARQGLHG